MKPCWNFWEHGVTQGCLSAYLNCPEFCKLKYTDGLGRSGGSNALQFGSLVHKVLERTYGLMSDIKPSPESAAPILKQEEQKLLDTYGNLLTEIDRESLEVCFSQAEAVLPGYFRYHNQDSNMDWLALEHIFEEPFVFPDGREILIRGKIDGLVMINGRLWVFETKTRGRIEESNIMELLPIDLQCNLYRWAAKQALEIVPAGVIYNIIRRPQLRRKDKESLKDFRNRMLEDVIARPEFYFHRYECYVLEEDHRIWMRDFESQLSSMRLWSEGILPHYRNPTSCQTRWGVCEFLPVCTRNDFNGFERRTEPFPELNEED